jgi:hypothetical protein
MQSSDRALSYHLHAVYLGKRFALVRGPTAPLHCTLSLRLVYNFCTLRPVARPLLCFFISIPSTHCTAPPVATACPTYTHTTTTYKPKKLRLSTCLLSIHLAASLLPSSKYLSTPSLEFAVKASLSSCLMPAREGSGSS